MQKAVTLCGSARFEAEYHFWNKILTLAGNTVFGLGAWPSIEGGKDWYTQEDKEILDAVHLAKIQQSQAIVVINSGGYIGDSTRREILWANVQGIATYYTDPHGRDQVHVSTSHLLGDTGARRSRLVDLIGAHRAAVKAT